MRHFCKVVPKETAYLLILLAWCGTACAQEASLAASRPYAVVSPPATTIATATPQSQSNFRHQFWDKRNLTLFSAAVALNSADFAVTRTNLQQGGTELNPMARILGRSTPGLAANFAGETAGVIGLSYLFHKTGHHKLERLTSLISISASGAAVTYGLTHR